MTLGGKKGWDVIVILSLLCLSMGIFYPYIAEDDGCPYLLIPACVLHAVLDKYEIP